MRLNKIVSIVLILVFIMNLTVFASTKSSSKEIYTQWTGGTSRTGDGTLASPYNMLDDAIKAANAGDTIIIKTGGQGAYMNEKSGVDSKPLIIDKDLTIKSQGTNPETLSIRLPGIILNANLTLENVTLDLPNRYHDHIFVNGYTLTLKEVTTLSGGREIDIFGGSAYDKQKQLISGYNASFIQVASNPGPKSTINIINNTNNLSRFGKIFAGSMNNESRIPVNINITGTNNKINLKGLYVSGADESTSSPDNFLGPEPEAPVENPTQYPVRATVDVSLNGYFPKVESKFQLDGAGADTVNLNLTTSENGLFNINISNISSLKLDGKAQPTSLSWKEGSSSTIDLSNENSELDLTALQNKELVVGSLVGGGKLRLASEGLLTITNNSTGNTEVMIGGFGDTSAYIRVPSKTYIKTPVGDTGTFELLPSSSQIDTITMVKSLNGEWNIVSKDGQEQLPTIYNSLEFKKEQPNDTITISEDGDITNYTYAELEFEIDPLPEDIFDFFELDLRLYVDGIKAERSSYEIWTYDGLDFWIGDNQDDYCLYVEKSEDSTQDTFKKQYNIKLELYQNDGDVLSSEVVLKINDTRKPAPEPETETDIKISFYKDDKELENQDSLTFLDTITIKADISDNFDINELQLKVNDNIINLDSLNIKVNNENMFKLGSNILKISYKGEEIKTINLEILKIKPSVTLKAIWKEDREVTIIAKVDANITDGTLKYTISNDENTIVKEFPLTRNTAIHKLELSEVGNYSIEATYISANDMYDNSEPSNTLTINMQPQLPTIIYDRLEFKENQLNDTITISNDGDITNYTYAELEFEINPLPSDLFDFLGLDLRLYFDGTKVEKNSDEIWTYNGLDFWIGENEGNYYLYVEKSEDSTQDIFNEQYNIKLELHQSGQDVLSDEVVLKINDIRNTAPVPKPEPKPEETDIKISFYKDDKELENQDSLTFLDTITIKADISDDFDINELQLKVNGNTINLDSLNIKVSKENMFKLGSNILKISYKGEEIKTINLEVLKIKPSVILKVELQEDREVTISAKVDANITEGTLKYTISNNENMIVKEFPLTSNTAIHKLELPEAGNYSIEATYISTNDMYDNSEPSNTLKVNAQPTIVPVERIEILTKDLTLDLKNYKTKQIEYKIYPEEASNKNVIFESSNEQYLEIDAKGNLIPKKVTLKNQPITVTVRTVSNDKTASINITIIDTRDSSTGSGSTGGGSTGGGSTGGGSTGGGSTGGGSTGGGSTGGGSTGNSSTGNSSTGNSSTGNSSTETETTDVNSTEIELVEDLINEEIVTEDEINQTINKEEGNILFSTGSTNSQPELSDIEEHWAENQINKLQDYKIITGFPDNEFKPNLSIKRGDLFVMMERVLKLTVGIDTDVEIKYFKDLSEDKYYYNAANNLISMGIISGFSDNTVRPEQEVTREEISVIVKNVLDKIEITSPTNEKKEFKDSGEISQWAVNSIEINTSLGILSGYPDNTFKPKNKVTRAETAVIIERLLSMTDL